LPPPGAPRRPPAPARRGGGGPATTPPPPRPPAAAGPARARGAPPPAARAGRRGPPPPPPGRRAAPRAGPAGVAGPPGRVDEHRGADHTAGRQAAQGLPFAGLDADPARLVAAPQPAQQSDRLMADDAVVFARSLYEEWKWTDMFIVPRWPW
jgi:hypothetical protein